MKKIFFAIGMFISSASAQDFGYEFAMLTDYRSLGVSYNTQQFSPRSSNLLTDSNHTAFNTALPFVEFRQNSGRLAVGYQTYTDINGKSRESFSVYADSQNDFPLGGSKQSKPSWFIPIVVSANYVRAQSPNKSSFDFDIGSFGLGTGISFKHFDRLVGMEASTVASLYYASKGFSTEYGTQTSLSGELKLIFSELLYQGVLVGYRFESQQWQMNDNSFDYRRQYHGAFIGFLF